MLYMCYCIKQPYAVTTHQTLRLHHVFFLLLFRKDHCAFEILLVLGISISINYAMIVFRPSKCPGNLRASRSTSSTCKNL